MALVVQKCGGTPISSRDGIYKVAQRIIITYNSGNDLVVVVSAPKEETGRLVSHAGVASRMFATLAYNNINIQMISTSDIKIAVAIEEKYTELAVRVLHETFIPDGKASSIYMN